MNYTTLKEITEKTKVYFDEYDIPYTDIIIEMYNNNNINPENYDLNNHIILGLIGLYYSHIYKNCELAKKYFIIANEKGNPDAMFNLGSYYHEIEKNYDEMKKYYLMAINKGNNDAMYNLGSYYEEIEKNYDEMKKYYLMAINKGNNDAIYNLGYYYHDIEKNYDEMKKYYIMAINKGDGVSMYYLGYYYKDIEKNYDEMKKYYLMAIEKGNSNAMFSMGIYYQNIEKNYDEMKKYYLMAMDKGNSNAQYYMGLYYYKKNDVEYMLKYICNGIENGNIPCLHFIIRYFNKNKPNLLKLFNILINLNKKSISVIYKIEELIKNKEIQKYTQKIIISIVGNTYTGSFKTCVVCFETNINIKFDCGHEICCNCYCSMKKCYYRCK
jgi:TPR repeat protein